MSKQSGLAGTYRSGSGNLPPIPPVRPRRRRRREMIAALIAILLIIVFVLLFFFPRPSATVALTPVSKPLSDSGPFTVAAHALTSAPQGSQTGVPTGAGKQGSHAVGVLKFKNYTLSWVTIPAGTIVTNVTNQQIMTDKALLVPPDPIVPGVASVSAHAVKVGKSGNIQAMSINKSCCFAGIVVLNESAYSGGVDDQAAPTVQQSDIDKVTVALKTSLMQRALADIQSQLKLGEQLVNATPQCSAKVTATPGVGESAANFTVNVSLTCSDSAYNPQTALSMAEEKLKQEAAQQFDAGFTLFGKVTTRIEQVTPDKNGNVVVQVSASGTWKYQFTAASKLNMAKHIARTTVGEAKAWLLRQIGVDGVSISVRGPIIDLSGGNIVPDDLSAITING